jgi:hypothetical protein
MTKADLMKAIAEAPDNAQIYVVPTDGIGRSNIEAEYEIDVNYGSPNIYISVMEQSQ